MRQQLVQIFEFSAVDDFLLAHQGFIAITPILIDQLGKPSVTFYRPSVLALVISSVFAFQLVAAADLLIPLGPAWGYLSSRR